MEGLRELASVEALRSPLSAGGGFPGGITPPSSREPAGLDSGPEAGDYSQSYLPGEGEGKGGGVFRGQGTAPARPEGGCRSSE